ncbi:hypothetical protein CDD81_3671 [Ophiocordyceps australis]|uniref:Arb2 domain-containing protein n=1 Tax=Ophiocordyceps australis TaxID=1399860 RepID=A0A2C5X760_9HYPO|nr:hypothetical protein CDD81_3671 [Ophiocordyceps australis]
MFRRHWSGLPKDPSFPEDLKALGYFVNDKDEVRLIENPDFYFKFFLSRNSRVNDRQRFAFNYALQRIIHSRLESLGLERIPLPLGTSPSQRHVPIYASANLGSKPRVVVIFGETVQDLGMLAGRVANGPGGIDKGSMVSVVRELGKQACSQQDGQPPGVLIANPGELYWWPDGGRSVTVAGARALPLPSAVHRGYKYVPAVNSVPCNEDSERHVEYIFNSVLKSLANEDAVISVVAIGLCCDLVTRFLDGQEAWAVWGKRLSSMLLCGHTWPDDCLENESFKDFLAKRARAYLVSSEPLDAPLAPPSGNIYQGIPNLGCPSHSSSEPLHTEMVLIRALEPALKYLETVAHTPNYENSPIIVTEPPPQDDDDEPAQDCWDELPDDMKPPIGKVNQEWMQTQVDQLRSQSEATGHVQPDDLNKSI